MSKVFQPGIYTISNADYHAATGISRSALMEFKKTPKSFHYKYLDPNYKPTPPTPQMEFGTAVHSYILEPHKFDEEYVIKPPKRESLAQVPLLKDVGREAYTKAKIAYEEERKKRKKEDAAFYQYSLGKTQISKEDFEEIRLMRESLMANEEARELLTGAQYEKSIFWVDEETGLTCKCRPDILFDGFVVDLKTTKDASFREFQKSFYNMSYYLQMAMIHLGLKATTGKSIMNFIDLAVEKEPPYLHCIYPIDEAAIEFGIQEFHTLLRELKECFDKNEWNGYPTQVLTLPPYALKKEM